MRELILLVGMAACAREATPIANIETSSRSRHVSKAEIVEQIRGALRDGVPIEALASRIDRKPTFDSTKGTRLAVLAREEFPPDPEHPDSVFRYDDARAVVYWILDPKLPGAHVVGVQANKDGRSALFFAVLTR